MHFTSSELGPQSKIKITLRKPIPVGSGPACVARAAAVGAAWGFQATGLMWCQLLLETAWELLLQWQRRSHTSMELPHSQGCCGAWGPPGLSAAVPL